MTAYLLVYDKRHLQADYQEAGSALEPYARQSSMGYLYLYSVLNEMSFIKSHRRDQRIRQHRGWKADMNKMLTSNSQSTIYGQLKMLLKRLVCATFSGDILAEKFITF